MKIKWNPWLLILGFMSLRVRSLAFAGAVLTGFGLGWQLHAISIHRKASIIVTEEETPNRHKEILKYGTPQSSSLRLKHNYVAATNFKHRVPIWVAEHLTAANLENNVDRDGVSFATDYDIPAFFRAYNDDYLRSGYSRGHMTPAGNNKHSAVAMQESFLLSSNIVPQELDNNCYYWNRIEKWARSLTDRFAHVRIISGPLWLPEPVEDKQQQQQEADNGSLSNVPVASEIRYKVIGKTEVAVPTHLYKVVLAESLDNEKYVACAVVPNHHIPDNVPLSAFLVPYPLLCHWAGIDFFPDLDMSSLKDLCFRMTDACQLMDARQHRIMQLKRSLKSSKRIYYLNKAYADLKKVYGDQPVPEDVTQLYKDRLQHLQTATMEEQEKS